MLQVSNSKDKNRKKTFEISKGSQSDFLIDLGGRNPLDIELDREDITSGNTITVEKKDFRPSSVETGEQQEFDFTLTFEDESRFSTQVQTDDYIEAKILGKGPRGPRGFQGSSSYELWLEAGNEGTIDDFLGELKVDVNYGRIKGKPSIEGVTLEGNKSFQELGVREITRREIENTF